MVFVSRTIAYPFFVVVILLSFFALLYIAFFNQAITVDNANSSVSISGDQIVVKIPMQNSTNHVINDVKVTIKSETGERAFYIKGSPAAAILAPGEKYEFLAAIPLGESYSYTAVVSAPFNRPINIKIDLDQGTVDPVDAQVSLPTNLVAKKEYTYSVKLCNVSQSDLAEVFWVENAETGDFKENSPPASFFERSVSLEKDECKTIYSTLTPIKTGEVTIGFSMRVGALKKEVSKVLTVEAA